MDYGRFVLRPGTGKLEMQLSNALNNAMVVSEFCNINPIQVCHKCLILSPGVVDIVSRLPTDTRKMENTD